MLSLEGSLPLAEGDFMFLAVGGNGSQKGVGGRHG